MTFEAVYQPEALRREDVEALPGALVIEFGTPWCGFCQRAQPAIQQALQPHAVRHVKVEDGPGRPLGRSFRVKLWPTLVFLKDGQEVARVVRPTDSSEITAHLAPLNGH
jgi:thioredoxin 1